MKIPALLHGTETEVRKHCRAVEKSIARGAPLAEALSSVEEIDTTDRQGLIVMRYERSPLAGQHFFPFILPDQIADGIVRGRIDRGRERGLFEELLVPPWGVIGLLSTTVGDRWTVRHAEWICDLVAAVRRHWEALVGERSRYTNGDPEGKQLYELPSFLGPALAYCGVPENALRAHLYTEGLRPFLPYLGEES
jgi:hypothetical protein